MRGILSLALGVFLLFPIITHAESCDGTPSEAVKVLPEPLATWGALTCTPFGDIISNHEGWIWSYPGGYSPVFIPAQMIQGDPKPLGNKSFFTSVTMMGIEGAEFDAAYSAMQTGFGPSKYLPKGYRLDATSASGDKLKLYFFEYKTYAWGIWTKGGTVDPQSRFMIMDMKRKPE